MSLLRCSRETELKQEMETGHWPEASTAELRAHVAGCSACRDAAMLRLSFRAARVTTLGEAQLPPPGLLWWRAQLRRRNAALARVQKPIVGAQIFALLMTLAIGVGFAIVELRSAFDGGFSMTSWVSSFSKSSAIHLEGLLTTAQSMLSESLFFLTPALVVLAVMAGLAALLVADRLEP